jgi:hypothetical protein
MPQGLLRGQRRQLDRQKVVGRGSYQLLEEVRAGLRLKKAPRITGRLVPEVRRSIEPLASAITDAAARNPMQATVSAAHPMPADVMTSWPAAAVNLDDWR